MAEIPTSKRPPTETKAKDKPPTVIWGKELESDDFIMVPRTMLYLGRFVDIRKRGIQPRHHLLILALAARKFGKKPIRAYWESIAQDLGQKKDTVRKWAYELRDMGLLRITQHRGRDPETNRVGYRNDQNSFDISPFVEFVKESHPARQAQRKKHKNGGDR
jgi:hypothetical protein